MITNRKMNYMTLGTTTALVAGMLLLSLPAFAQDANSLKPEANITVQDISTAQIASFIQRVWRESPLVQKAEAEMYAARAQAKADSKWRYNPEVEFEVEDKDGEERTKLIGLSQTIDWNGKFRAASEVAEYEFEVAIAERDDARQTIAADILTALADFHAAREVLSLYSERADLMERFALLAERKFNAGDIDQSEYNLAQLALSEALIQYAYAESELGEFRLALQSLMGFSINTMTAFPTLPDMMPEISGDDQNLDELIMELPAIRALKYKAKAARASIKQARRERLPDPTISLKGGKEEGINLIGVFVSIPLNIFNTYSSEVEVARYRNTAQAKSLQSAFFVAKSRYYSSKKRYELSARAWDTWKGKGRKALEEQIDTLAFKFKVGDLSATDYLVQVQQTLDTRIASRELYGKAWKAWFSWVKASGNIEEWLQGE